MSYSDLARRSLEQSISRWPALFSDLNGGGDTERWQGLAVRQLAPAALRGQIANGVTVSGIFEKGEQTRFSFPAFFDGDPLQTSDPTPKKAKARFNGESEEGIMVVTDTNIKMITLFGGAVVPSSFPRASVTHLNEVSLKFSLSSMTSAGGACEMFLEDGGETGRLLFRVALEARDGRFVEALRSMIGLPEPGADTTSRGHQPRVFTVPAGWYPDPALEGRHRWWDGAAWTEHVG